MSISTIILTRNEEKNLDACLDSLSWCDDVHVFDSFSTDATTDIARRRGAHLVQRAFTHYSEQRNAALDTCPLRHPWVLMLDADERVEPGTERELLGVAQRNGAEDAWRIRRKDYFMGRWIKHSTLYPSWFVRLFRHASIRYDERAVHEYPAVMGPVGELSGHLIHDSFNKGFDEWWQKHEAYAELEAQEMLRQSGGHVVDALGALSLDPVRRRRVLKALSYRMPWRPQLRFLYMYLFRLGLLDGVPGYRYCRLIESYQARIDDAYERLRR